MFPVDNFKSFYNDKLENKKSGTVVALYVHEQFNAVENDSASMTKAHIESLFLHVTQDNFKANVGVVYRPPNSSINDFKDDIQNLIKTLPKTNVTYILGDFNLHKSAMNPIVDTFEQFFYI